MIEKGDRKPWVNAVITLVIPMDDVAVTEGKYLKQDEAGNVLEDIMERLATSPYEITGAARWEDRL